MSSESESWLRDPSMVAATFIEQMLLPVPAPTAGGLAATAFVSDWGGVPSIADWLHRKEIAGVSGVTRESDPEGTVPGPVFADGYRDVAYVGLLDRSARAGGVPTRLTWWMTLAFREDLDSWLVVGIGDRMMGPPQARQIAGIE